MSAPGSFVERWSRLKKAAANVSADTPAGEMPDAESLLAKLGPDSDFGVFMREEVSEVVRRKAMKTLFADPHFNIMDGLDTYIDDYSISEPIPPEMLATLHQARMLFDTPEAEPAPEMECEKCSPAVSENEGGDEQKNAAQLGQEAVPQCDILASDGQNVALENSQENVITQNQ